MFALVVVMTSGFVLGVVCLCFQVVFLMRRYLSPGYSSKISLVMVFISLLLGHVNVRSLLPSLDELRCFLNEKKFDIMGVCETWLDEMISDREVNIPGYCIVRKDRNRHGGGVAIFVADNLKFTWQFDFESNAIEVFPRSKRSMLICCSYRPPNFKPEVFFEVLSTQCECSQKTGSDIFILGDLNADLFSLRVSSNKGVLWFL